MAAEKGDTGAMTNLGSFYLSKGNEIENMKFAAEWFRKAAELGLDNA